MTCPTSKTAMAVVVLLVALSAPAVAQQAPAGSCLLPDGKWCWPTVPATYGAVCECQTSDGPRQGVGQ
ncbi:hypothetical protein jaqu_29710 [Jannaschia aquimarina]|uniref:Uncharacterized protein n=1 Tax=Jannaschia aquimarina TaxID=935700 RepID=A0A0D1EEQ5_9RHOB|nr:hypothetical protein jaqu_29710 [Jannaschia aquimarina]SNS51971.1 hypothetical protein SAMN05421775_101285 [Jannaschia aquimarina]